MVQVWGYPIESRTFPLLVAVLPLLFFSLVQTIVELKAIGLEKAAAREEDKGVARKTVIVFIWVAGFFVLIGLLGFLRAIPIFSFLFLKFYWREKWYIALLITLFIEAFVYGVFVTTFNITLYEGIFWE